jgi:hypothetical protein
LEAPDGLHDRLEEFEAVGAGLISRLVARH